MDTSIKQSLDRESNIRSWIVCATVALVLASTTGIQANIFGVFLPFVVKSGYTSSEASLMMTFRSVSSFVALTFVSFVYDKIDIRKGLTLMCLLSAVASVLYAFAPSMPFYYLAAVVAGIVTAWGGMVPVTALINKWFKDKLGEAISICAIGSGIPLIVMPPLLTALMERTSLRMGYLVCAASSVLIGILAFAVIRNNPRDLGLHAYQQMNGKEEKNKIKHVFQESPMPRYIFVICLALFLLMAMGISSYSSFLVMHFTGVGYTAAQAASIMSVYGIFLSIGKFLYGVLYDRIGGRRSTMAVFSALAAGVFGCLIASGGNMIIGMFAGVMLGLGAPISMMGGSFFATDLSIAQDYHRNLQAFQLAASIGGIVMASVPGFLYDVFGSFRPLFAVVTAYLVVLVFTTRMVYRKMGR